MRKDRPLRKTSRIAPVLKGPVGSHSLLCIYRFLTCLFCKWKCFVNFYIFSLPLRSEDNRHASRVPSQSQSRMSLSPTRPPKLWPGAFPLTSVTLLRVLLSCPMCEKTFSFQPDVYKPHFQSTTRAEQSTQDQQYPMDQSGKYVGRARLARIICVET